MESRYTREAPRFSRFLLLSLGVLYIFWILDTSQIYDLEIFSVGFFTLLIVSFDVHKNVLVFIYLTTLGTRDLLFIDLAALGLISRTRGL